MSDARAGLDYSKFTQSLQRLQEQHEHLLRDIEGLPDWDCGRSQGVGDPAV